MSQHLSTFGTAYEQDDSLLIPVAFVAGGGGGATSNSPFTNAFKQVGADTINEDAPHDVGCGFGGDVIPVGVYVVKDQRV